MAFPLFPMNVIDVRLSGTDADAHFNPPIEVLELSVAHQMGGCYDDGEAVRRSKYMVLSQASAVTDFHVESTGTAVCYYVLAGSQIFILLDPTKSNMRHVVDYNNDPERKGYVIVMKQLHDILIIFKQGRVWMQLLQILARSSCRIGRISPGMYGCGVLGPARLLSSRRALSTWSSPRGTPWHSA